MSGWAQPGRVARPGPGRWQDGDAYVHDRGWQGGLSPQAAHPRPRPSRACTAVLPTQSRAGPARAASGGAGSAADPRVAAPGRRASAPAPPPPRGDRAQHVSPRRESAAQRSELPAEPSSRCPGGGRGTQRSGGRGNDAGARELLAANPPAASLLNSED